VLEVFASEQCKWMFENCSSYHGERSTMFWKVHADEGPGHVEQTMKYILKLEASELEAVAINLRQTAFYYSEIYREIEKKSKGKERENVEPLKAKKPA
jgi:hypothetical protein